MVECCRSRSLPRSLGGLSPLCGGAGAFPLQRSNLGQTTPCRGSLDHGVPGQLRARTPGDGDDSQAIQLAPASCASNSSPSTIGSSLGHWVNLLQQTRLVSNTIFRNFYRQWVFDLVNQATSPIRLLQKGNRVLTRCDRLGGIGSIEQLGGRRGGWSPALKQFRRTPTAVRSHLGLAWHCVRRSRAGGGARQDCIELGGELGKPRVLFLESLSAPPAFGYSRCSIA